MIIIEVAGGLGNQLQQYALYRKFESLGREVKLDISWFEDKSIKETIKKKTTTERKLELDYFDNLIYDTCTRQEKKALIGGDNLVGKIRRKIFPSTIYWFKETEMYHPEVLNFDNMYISGYFACEKYYRDVLPDLREKIKFPPGGNFRNEEIVQEMRKRNSVSVHIRRGDYLSPENKEMFGNICTDVYYKRAMEIMKAEIPDAHFYIFSDDIPYAKEKYQSKEYTIVDINHGRDNFYDMWLMSNCKNNICANSTFSFWGARLNKNDKKIMIRPTIHKNSQVFQKEEMEELWKGWRFVSPEGK